MSIENLREERRELVEALRKNGFEDGFKHLLTELYPDNAHFIYELLQNAEDARASVVRFTLSDSAVEFEHDGERLFVLKDVVSITGIGVSTKRDDPTSIGKFGVGFKAVFAYTNTPEIHSGDFHFRIHDLVVPETYGVSRATMSERETRFVFPFNNPKKPCKRAVEEVERGLRALGDNTLLFLSHIRKIEYLLPDGSLGTLERTEKEKGLIEIHTETSATQWLRYQKDVDIEDESGATKTCRVAIAYQFNIYDKKVHPLHAGQVSIYFPAEKETSNLRFHLHAPFASTVARDSVRDCEGNRKLRDHLADLVVESLTAIRDQGMLTVGFLAVLPNPQDNLPVFYEPIRVAIVQAFKDDALTPTRSGAYARATGLYRGPVRIQEVLDDDDLSLLTQYEAPLWVKNPPPQENPCVALFLDSLEIKAWGWDELAKVVNKPHLYAFSPQRLENFIEKKEDAWLLRFYALLGEASDAHGKRIKVDDLRIIRVVSETGNQHATAGETYFSPEEDTSAAPSDVLFVKPSVYAIGRSDSQKKFARSFLERAGVRPYDEKAGIERILEQYRTSQATSIKTNIKHIRQFVNFWLVNPNSIEMFNEISFLFDEVENGHERHFKASDLYLDSPYIGTGLAALFNDNSLSIEKPKQRLSAGYLSIKKFEEFADALGVMRQLEICAYKATEMQKVFFQKTGRETASTVDEDYFINGIRWHRKGSDGFIGAFDLSNSRSVALSHSIWNTMCKADPKMLVAQYIPNEKRRNEKKSKSSFLVDHLAENSWVPDRDGHFLRPSEVTQETLHSDFKFDDRNGWLTAIQFGESTRKRSEEYRSRNRDAQNMGFASAEVAEEVARLLKDLTVEDIRSMAAQRKQTEQPNQSAHDPDRRRKHVLTNMADAPSKESVLRERSIQIGIRADTVDAKTYLRANYKNAVGDLVCQCCQQEMPFRLRTGEHYFEAVQCVADNEKLHMKTRLALCPTCAAMYQHARETDDTEIRRRIVEHTADDQTPSVEIPVRLAGRDHTLRFVGTHWLDLKTVLSVMEKVP